MAFFFFPPLAYAALRVVLPRWRTALRPLLISSAIGAMCLLVYAYLPLRAQAEPPLNLGTPVTLERVYWVVSAQVYAREMGDENPQPVSERYLDVVVVLVEQFGWLVAVLGTCGAYFILRVKSARALGGLWLLTAASVLLVRPWLGPVRGNPDSVGYLIAGLCATAALALSMVCTTLALWKQAREGSRPAQGVAIALGLAALLGQVATHARASSLASFTATDPFDELRYRSLPARSVVVATTPQTVFRHVELQSAERTRPDLLLVPLPFLRYPGVAEAVVSRAPSTAALVDAYMARDALDPRALIQLARVRPVFVELDTTHISPSDYFALTPAGPLYRVLDHPSSRPAWPELVAAQERSQRGLLRALPHIDMDVEAKRQVLWLHYTDALYFAALGHRKAAQRSLAAGARLYPNDVHLRAMQKALATSQADGPIDVTPFLRVDSLLAP
jgi:hypothetical protein